jgi:hypothetical protein
MQRTRLRPPGGSSLAEFMVIVGVMAILAGLTVLGVRSLEGTASEAACSTDVRRLRQAQDTSLLMDGEYLSETELVEANRLRVESDQFDLVVLRDDYRILPVGDCAELVPAELAASGQAGALVTDLGQPVARDVPAETPGRCARGQVDLNTATPDQLQRLTHVGPDEAAAIVAMRPVEDLWELAAIPGMTPEELAELLTQGVACI